MVEHEYFLLRMSAVFWAKHCTGHHHVQFLKQIGESGIPISQIRTLTLSEVK